MKLRMIYLNYLDIKMKHSKIRDSIIFEMPSKYNYSYPFTTIPIRKVINSLH